MIVDSSAVLAILLQEPDAARFANMLAASPGSRMAAPTWLEAGMVAASRGSHDTALRFEDFIVAQDIEVVAFTPSHPRLALEAWRKFGRGRHPAKLNFGDCVAYALAKESGEPLLFKGDDFPQTDIESALKD